MFPIEKDIRRNYKVYLLKNNPQRYDYMIRFIWNKQLGFLTQRKTSRIFIYFYERHKNIFQSTLFISFNQFQLILREILQDYFYHHGGIILHSSACEIGGRAYLFTGDSGAGKSTIRRLLEPEYKSLSDDFSIIKKVGCLYYYFQTPIAEKEGRMERSLKGWRIGKVFFLNKSIFCRYTRIKDKNKCLSLFLPQILVGSKGLSNFQMEFITAFVSGFDNFYNLDFDKNNVNLITLFKT
ncbi:MAG: hypothetical protein M1366_01650 [Patescibacteria group bacterium]|nr:hypothetical protein [Patescibacteria group bacterium]